MEKQSVPFSEDEDFLLFRNQGEAEALARVFDSVAPRLLLLAGHFTQDANQAEDLVQITFLQAIRDADRFDGKRPVGRWLAGILKHRALDGIRQRRNAQTEAWQEVAVESLDPAEIVADQEGFARIVAVIDSLVSPYREVLSLRIVHGIAPTQIAHTLGRSPSAVRMQLKRGLEKLRQAFPEHAACLGPFLLVPGRGADAIKEVVLERAADIPLAGLSAPTVLTGGGGIFGGILMMKTLIGIGIAVSLFFVYRAVSHSGSLGPGAGLDRGVVNAGPEGSTTDRKPELQGDQTEPSLRTDLDQGAGIAKTEVAPMESAFVVRVHHASDGKPAADVGVYLRGVDEGGLAAGLGVEMRTGPDGTARFLDLAPASYQVHLDRGDLARMVHTQRQTEAEFVLPAGDGIEGKVVDLVDQPVAHARVYRVNGAHADALQLVATCDGQGAFEIRDMDDGVELIARADGFQPSELRSWGLRGDPVLVLGAKGHRMHGRVIDPEGQAVPYAWLAFGVDEDARESLEGSTEVPAEQSRRKAMDLEGILVRADEHGRFESTEVPAGYTLVMARPLDTTLNLVGLETLWIPFGGEGEVTVQLQAGAKVHGHVRDDRGQGLGGMPVEAGWEGSRDTGQMEDDIGPWMSHRRTVTAADGSFEILGLLPGDYDLETLGETAGRSSRGNSGVSGPREEKVLLPGEVYLWNPVIPSEQVLVLEVLDPAGDPLEGWRVSVSQHRRRMDTEDMRNELTDGNGLLRLVGLRAELDQVISLFAPLDSGGFSAFPVRSISARDAKGSKLQVRIDASERDLVSILGTIVDANGEKASGVGLELEDEGERFQVFGFSGADGQFAFHGLPKGAYFLQTIQGKRDLSSFSVSGSEPVDLGDVRLP